MNKLEHEKTVVPKRSSKSTSPLRNNPQEKENQKIKRTFCYSLLQKVLADHYEQIFFCFKNIFKARLKEK